VTFDTARLQPGTSTLVEFADHPVVREIVSADANILTADYVGTTVVIPPPPLEIERIERTPDGTIRLSLNGLPRSEYVIYASSDLTTWLPVATNRVGSDGRWEYSDDPGASNPQRFYRAVRVP